MDADHAGALAVRVAARLDALVAPTLGIGCSEHHMAFAGNLSISPLGALPRLLPKPCAARRATAKLIEGP
ncbi:creatininase family protein [Amycolatopsis sulphurea]|uniref:creatininase family protein n=1 Tax=Amycolatopsis sulphurea TaxID=76022 RepID=UPI001B808D92